MSANLSQSAPSRKATKLDKPPKPYPDFPLTPHNGGAWMKKINGRIHYFGKWGRIVDGVMIRIENDGWADALQLYKAQADDLHAGRRPRIRRAVSEADEKKALTVADLCNRFLTAKLRKRTSGELDLRTFAEYKQTTDLITAAFGTNRPVDNLAADDFEELRAQMAQRWGPVRLGNAITRVKSVFKYGVENKLMLAPSYGSEFKKPDKGVLRRHRSKNGEKMLQAGQLRKLIETADVQLKAMILLGINCGFGNTDIASLSQSAVDLEDGWIDFPRPKTGIERRCPIWPETVSAMRDAIAERPTPKSKAEADLIFLLPSGRRWVRNTEKSRADMLSVCFRDLLKKLAVYREGVNFYVLRHTFRTIADAARDPVAIDLIMGHSDPSVGGHYSERIDDSRLRAVAEYVRQWLFGRALDDGKSRPASGTSEASDAGND